MVDKRPSEMHWLLVIIAMMLTLLPENSFKCFVLFAAKFAGIKGVGLSNDLDLPVGVSH